MSNRSNSKQPEIPRTNSLNVSRPPQPKLLRAYSPIRDGFFDVLQEVMFDHLTVNANENDLIDRHFATVYRVEESNGFIDSLFGSGQVRVRARIDEPDNSHSTIMIP